MSEQWTMEEVQQTLVSLYQKAATDPAFRKRCLSDPDGAIEQLAGKSVVEKGKIRFSEDAKEASASVFALPPAGATEKVAQDSLLPWPFDWSWPWTSFTKTCKHHPCKKKSP